MIIAFFVWIKKITFHAKDAKEGTPRKSFCAQKLLRKTLSICLGAIFVPNLFCSWSAKFILLLECKIYFASFGVQNLFCFFWSAKFILLLLECKIYFASFGVQNLFCSSWSAL